MVKKYSPTTDSNDKPIMKIDSDGHFVHKDDYDKLVNLIENHLAVLDGYDPSVFVQMRLNVVASLHKSLALLK